MSEEDAFRAALAERPDDETARLVYADWLDERDRHEEAARHRGGYRALVKLRRQPRDIDYYRDGGSHTMHCFSNKSSVGMQHPNDLCGLPSDWFSRMKPPADLHQNAPDCWRDYRTAEEAWEAAAMAFAELPPERRAELLAGRAA